MFRLPILIRKIRYRVKDNMPRQFLMAMYHIISELQSRTCILELQPNKGVGIRRATLDRYEKAFVKFLRANYGLGEYSVVICKGGRGGFKLFWRGVIEKDRYIRLKGSMSPYILSETPIRAWHNLEEIKP